MKINRAKTAGFCFGVRRALTIAMDAARSNQKVYMLGDIVHNENVVSEIEKAGIKKIKQLGHGKGKTLLIRAHGTQQKTLQKARQAGYTIIDATCPMVKEIHTIAKKMEREGRQVIILGDKNHDEVQGINGQLKQKAIIISSPATIPSSLRQKKVKKAGIVVQSTQNSDNVSSILKILRPRIPNLVFHNTVCNPTRKKQDEAKELPLKNDVVLVIGSKTSANTKRLYEISKALNPKTYWITSRNDIQGSWFKDITTVGVTAGASTPESTIDAIISYVKKIT
jgi:4-hydroxy-3-methylbut-2-enyl diphosphate reductase